MPQIEKRRYYATTDGEGRFGGGPNITKPFEPGKPVCLENPKGGKMRILAASTPIDLHLNYFAYQEGYRLFEIEGRLTEVFDREPPRGALRAAKVIREVPVDELWGPNGKAAEILIHRWRNITEEQLQQIVASKREIYPSVEKNTYAQQDKRGRAGSNIAELVTLLEDDSKRSDFGISLSAGVTAAKTARAIIVADLIPYDDLMDYIAPFLQVMTPEESKEFLSLLPQKPEGFVSKEERYPAYEGRWIPEIFTPDRPLQISAREEQAVRVSLGLPKNYKLDNKTVVSVGEGLSDFARNIGAWAVDPIYEVKDILKPDPRALRELLDYSYRGRVVFRPDYQLNRGVVPLPDPSKMINTTADKLPMFGDESVDAVLGSQLLTYIDLGTTIPELARIIKPEGEIRLSGDKMQIQIDPETRLPSLVPGVSVDMSLDGFYLGTKFYPATGLEEALKFARRNGLKMYVGATRINQEKSNIYPADVVVFKKDDETPVLDPMTDEMFNAKYPHHRAGSNWREAYPYIGKLFIVDPDKQPSDNSYYDGIYPLQLV